MVFGSDTKTGTPKVLQWVGGIGGLALGKYSGVSLLIPAVLTAAIWWCASKLLKDDNKPMVPTIAVNAGHAAWMLLSLLMLGASALALVGPDLVVYVIGLGWLLLRPGRGALYLLFIFQIITVAVNLFMLSEAGLGSPTHKALLVHVVWRCMAMFYMFQLYWHFKKQPGDDEPMTEILGD